MKAKTTLEALSALTLAAMMLYAAIRAFLGQP